jgi:hypothetical protein
MSEYAEGSRRLRETTEVLRRAHPAYHPSAEDIARLHELHAQHEAERGDAAAAVTAAERAKRARVSGARNRLPGVGGGR